MQAAQRLTTCDCTIDFFEALYADEPDRYSGLEGWASSVLVSTADAEACSAKALLACLTCCYGVIGVTSEKNAD